MLGRATGPQQERGVYRTTDGGRTWTRSLFVDENHRLLGLTLDAKDASTLFAGMWQVEMHTWAMFSGGPSSALYVTHDAGVTWTRVAHPGLPKSPCLEDRRRDRAVGLEARVRADSDRGSGFGVALG